MPGRRLSRMGGTPAADRFPLRSADKRASHTGGSGSCAIGGGSVGSINGGGSVSPRGGPGGESRGITPKGSTDVGARTAGGGNGSSGSSSNSSNKNVKNSNDSRNSNSNVNCNDGEKDGDSSNWLWNTKPASSLPSNLDAIDRSAADVPAEVGGGSGGGLGQSGDAGGGSDAAAAAAGVGVNDPGGGGRASRRMVGRDAMMARKLLRQEAAERAYLDQLRETRSRYHRERTLAKENLLNNFWRPESARRAAVIMPGGRYSADLLDQEIERLKMRSMEMEFVLRVEMGDTQAFEAARDAVDASLAFLSDLKAVATEFHVLQGTLFQELLNRRVHSLDGVRTIFVCRSAQTLVVGLVPIEERLSENQIAQKVQDATRLCSLLRVKVEDDQDLELAWNILFEAQSFFCDLTTVADLKQVELGALFSTLQVLQPR